MANCVNCWTDNTCLPWYTNVGLGLAIAAALATIAITVGIIIGSWMDR